MSEQLNSKNHKTNELNIDDSDYRKLLIRLKDISETIFSLEKIISR